MEAIDAGLPATDGVACFNRMYLEVTRDVGSRLGQGFFADPQFMSQLDVTFANLYLTAADSADDPASVPLAWRPLVERRTQPGIEPIQFALAGMNTHINNDLPVAMVSTCASLSTAPGDGAHFADYQKVDLLLNDAERSIRQAFESSPELAVDRHLAAVCDLIGNWTIDSARDMAWNNCLLLWELRNVPPARALFLDGLAAGTAMASRLLLVSV